MSALKCVSILAALMLSSAVGAADDCTFDQDHQVRVVAAVAKLMPGASIEHGKKRVSWKGPNKESTVFGYGGCFDLGSTVSRSTPMKKPRTREQVFALAKRLAQRFWSNEPVSERSATEALVSGISASRFSIESDGEETMYVVSAPGYAQLYVLHRYAKGVDQVMIAWQGDY